MTLLSSASYMAFMMDISTDISGDEQETIYVRFVDKGDISEKFLAIGSPVSTTYLHLYEFVTSTFQSTGLRKFAAEKLIGMGSDGASNMVGVHGGLAMI